MHRNGLADDEAIGHELADCLAGVGIGDLADFVWVEPDLALAAVAHGRGEALLGAEVRPAWVEWSAKAPWSTIEGV